MVNSMVELRNDDTVIHNEIDGLQTFLQKSMEKLVFLGQEQGEITTDLPAAQIAAVLMVAREGFQVAIDYDAATQAMHDTLDTLMALIRAK